MNEHDRKALAERLDRLERVVAHLAGVIALSRPPQTETAVREMLHMPPPSGSRPGARPGPGAASRNPNALARSA